MRGAVVVEEMMRTHVVLPRDLVEAVDRLVGQRKRSEFVAAAVCERLDRENLRAALRETAGSLNLADYPEWSTPEKTSAWVRELRREDDQATERKLRRQAR
jgi:metal-responsive CopG/Arc/MetJ family transcriptional regulator